MATEIRLPQLGQTMEEGTIVSCMVNIGDEVKRGDVIFEVETDKATLEMESPADGFVKYIITAAGQTLPVGDAVMVLGEKDEDVPQSFADSLSSGAPAAAAAATSPAPETAATPKAKSAEVPQPENVTAVRLPQLGQTMEEGTIVSCMVNVGDEVKRGGVIFEVETDKATLEMESPADGFVKYVIAQAGQTLPVGDAVMVLGEKDVDVPQSFVDSLSSAAPAAGIATETAPAVTQPAASGGRVKASPRAKKLAAKLGVDLSTVTGTGSAGRISEQDVEKAASAEPATTGGVEATPGQTIPVNRLQRITAEKMLLSKQQIPCFYLSVKADVTDLVEYRTKLNQSGDVKVAYNDFILRAVAVGLEKYPIMTGQLDGDVIKLADSIGIGLAISVEDGLVAPIIKDVNKKDATQIARDSKALIEKARNNKLDLSDLQGGCITLSNLGAFGIDSFTPIVVPGQCSILGIGQISDTCMPDNDDILVRKIMSMTLSVDHKVANGAYAAQFLDFVRKQLEDPASFA